MRTTLTALFVFLLLVSVHADPKQEQFYGAGVLVQLEVPNNWSQSKDYLEGMSRAIQGKILDILEKKQVFPPSGTKVVVRFAVESEAGRVTDIRQSKSTGGRQADRFCREAILAASPFGPWKSEIKAAVGNSQEFALTFVFDIKPERPNQALLPTPTAVTPPAAQASRQP